MTIVVWLMADAASFRIEENENKLRGKNDDYKTPRLSDWLTPHHTRTRLINSMAPPKSKKARGKQRARRSPSFTPPTLTPPPTRRRGRPPGAQTYSTAELKLLLKAIQKVQPRAGSDWVQVERRYNAAVPSERQRRAENLKSRFHKVRKHCTQIGHMLTFSLLQLVHLKKPTGDPETNRLHEEALMLDEELDALEHTQVLDDSPAPAASSDDTIDLETSDSEMEILADVPARVRPPAPPRVPAPAPVPPARAAAPASAKRKAEPSPAFRAVARKVGSNTRPAQSQAFLDAATTQIASVFSPANEERLLDRQREDITILTLNDTIRDLRAELSQERERRLDAERRLQDQETRQIIAQQVQQQLRQHIPTHHAASIMQPPAENLSSQSRFTNPPRSVGEAHPSWMAGQPPERSDASGSGGM
ncbi:hypothetical protein FRC12_003603 [Ceratobasidium sp. 428]|nr:hypothetical protein FRC12_003603 [Ceratobasidium sp. 428]